MASAVSDKVKERRNRVLLGPLPADFLRVSISPQEQQEQADRQAALALQQQMQLPYMAAVPSGAGRLSITIAQAKLAKNYGMTRMDPFCRLRVGHVIYETHTDINGGKNPRWNKVIYCLLPHGVNTINIEIFDERNFTMDELIAWTQINVPEQVFAGQTHEDWYPLSGKQGEGLEGMINLVLSFAPSNYIPEQPMILVPRVDSSKPKVLNIYSTPTPAPGGPSPPAPIVLSDAELKLKVANHNIMDDPDDEFSAYIYPPLLKYEEIKDRIVVIYPEDDHRNNDEGMSKKKDPEFPPVEVNAVRNTQKTKKKRSRSRKSRREVGSPSYTETERNSSKGDLNETMSMPHESEMPPEISSSCEMKKKDTQKECVKIDSPNQDNDTKLSEYTSTKFKKLWSHVENPNKNQEMLPQKIKQELINSNRTWDTVELLDYLRIANAQFEDLNFVENYMPQNSDRDVHDLESERNNLDHEFDKYIKDSLDKLTMINLCQEESNVCANSENVDKDSFNKLTSINLCKEYTKSIPEENMTLIENYHGIVDDDRNDENNIVEPKTLNVDSLSQNENFLGAITYSVFLSFVLFISPLFNVIVQKNNYGHFLKFLLKVLLRLVMILKTVTVNVLKFYDWLYFTRFVQIITILFTLHFIIKILVPAILFFMVIIISISFVRKLYFHCKLKSLSV